MRKYYNDAKKDELKQEEGEKIETKKIIRENNVNAESLFLKHI